MTLCTLMYMGFLIKQLLKALVIMNESQGLVDELQQSN